MDVETVLTLVVVIAMLILMVIIGVWTWRDMDVRNSPRWMRWAVLVGMWTPPMIGLPLWMYDRYKRPHAPGVTRRDQVFQTWRNP